MHAIAMVAILISITSLNAAPLSFSAAVKGCAREDLQAAVDGYLDAMRKGTPSSMPMASAMKYMENRRELPLGQGIWKTPLDINFSRSLLDTETCESYTEIIHASSLHPYVIGTRLKLVDNKISEIESLVTDQDDWLFNGENYLKYSSQEKWDILPVGQRSDRRMLIDVANAYFDVFSDRSASSRVPWGIPCARLEGGAYTNPKGNPQASCIGGPPLEGTLKITNRRFLVDTEMGTVVGLADFGAENGWPDSHIIRLENGKVRFVHTLTVCPNGCKLPAAK